MKFTHYICGIALVIISFDSDADFPLYFAVLPDSGLTHLCGKGTVRVKDGPIITLPPTKEL